jgi:hypothetical protein
MTKGPLKGAVGLIEDRLTSVLTALELLLLAEEPPELVLIQPDGAHGYPRSQKLRPSNVSFRMPEVLESQMHAGNADPGVSLPEAME